MRQAVIISNPGKLDQKKAEFQKAGKKKIHLVSDFDRTLTYGLTEQGKKTRTVISMLRSEEKYLGKEYIDQAIELFDKYHPIEIDPQLPLEKKKQKMHEWWKAHFDLIIKSGLTKSLINKIIQEKPLNFRKYSQETLNFLNQQNIPLIILSAAPGDMIEAYLQNQNLLFKQISIIGNKYKWKNQKATEIQEPIIHTFNKREISLANTSIFEKVKNKKYVILLGDSLGDIDMAEGFPYKEIIKIGFLNENIEENIDKYKQSFDIILTGDQDFSYVDELIKEILNN